MYADVPVTEKSKLFETSLLAVQDHRGFVQEHESDQNLIWIANNPWKSSRSEAHTVTAKIFMGFVPH